MTNMNRMLPLAAVLLVAALAVSRARPEPAAAPQPPTAERAAASVGNDATSSTPPEPCGLGEQMLAQYAALYHGAAQAQRFLFVIALVPDPEESGHTDYFDAVLEGVEDAAAAGLRRFWRRDDRRGPSRYVRDRHWLPWPGSDKDKRKLECWTRVPGVMVYRPLERVDEQPALVALLVGETPTWGVRSEVLEAALRTVDRARSVEPGERTRHYRILGPTFSGTASSLRAGIRQHALALRDAGVAEPALRLAFHVASASATGVSVKPLLEAPFAPELGVEVRYESATPDDETLLRTMLAFLQSAGGSSAILGESMTAYGEGVSAFGQGMDAPLVHWRFPPNIASMRRAYTEVQEKDGAAALTRAPSAARTAPAEERGELSDQTPITHDLALAEVLRELGRREIRNVGIVATDARDVIFIAERVGRQLPDVRLFTIGHDIRYLHPDHVSALNGLLVAHAAPTLTGVARDGSASTVLQNPLTETVSAAGRLLLAGRPLEPWARVSLIGNGSLRQIWPDTNAAGRQRQAQPVLPRSFQFTYYLAIAVFLATASLIAVPALARRLQSAGPRNPLPEVARRSAFLRQRSWFWSLLGRVEHRDLAADDAFATASLITIAASVPVLMAAAEFRLRPLPWTAYGVAIPLLAVPVIWLRTRAHFGHCVRSAWLLAALASIVALFATSLGCAPPREATFWLLSGGSPLIGALLGLGMLLVVVWCWRARLRLLDTLRFGAVPGARFAEMTPVIAQALGQAEARRTELLELERRLLQVVRSPWGAAPLIPFLINALVCATVGLIWLLKPPLTFEGGFRGWVLLGFACACILPITTYFARMIVTARALMRLLRSVARFGLLDALGRLPPELARRLETQLVRGGRAVGELAHPVALLKQLAQHEPERAAVALACEEQLALELRYEAGEPEPAGRLSHAPAELANLLLQEASALSRDTRALTPVEAQLRDDFRASLIAIFIARYVGQLRLLVPPVLLGSVLATLMTSLYFVQPRHLIASACFVWVAVIVLVIVASYVSLARDPVISAIGRTPAGTVSWSLAARVFAVTVVPLGSFLASQYPEFTFWVTSLLGGLARFVQ